MACIDVILSTLILIKTSLNIVVKAAKEEIVKTFEKVPLPKFVEQV